MNFFLISFLCSVSMHAQQPEFIIKKNELRLDLIGPAAVYEQRILKNFALTMEGGISPHIRNSEESKKSLQVRPYLQFEQRIYTRILQKKAKLDQSPDLRGEYIGFRSHFSFGDRFDSPWQTFGPVVGQTSKIGKKGFLSGALGYGMYHINQKISGTFLYEIGLGLAF